MALTALDADMRVSEMLSLPRQNVDFDNLTLRVQGKGNKLQLVPVSTGQRKALYRYLTRHEHAPVLASGSGRAPTVRNSERDSKAPWRLRIRCDEGSRARCHQGAMVFLSLMMVRASNEPNF
jgi:integrase